MTKAIIKRAFGALGFNISRRNRQFDRYDELYEKYQAFTMIPRDYYGFNLDLCNAYRRLDGDYVECGVWRLARWYEWWHCGNTWQRETHSSL